MWGVSDDIAIRTIAAMLLSKDSHGWSLAGHLDQCTAYRPDVRLVAVVALNDFRSHPGDAALHGVRRKVNRVHHAVVADAVREAAAVS